MRRSGKLRRTANSGVRIPGSREYAGDVDPISERELKDAYAGTRVEIEPPRAVLSRLELVERLLLMFPEGDPGTPQVVWLDPKGTVARAPIGETPLTVGREAGCDVLLARPRVSRRHCQLRRVPGMPDGVEIEDLGSSNGTKVNGVMLPAGVRRALADGDVIEVGGVPLVVMQATES